MNVDKQTLATEVIKRLKETIPEPVTELHYKNGYELLVAVILSAQCTDKRVNATTPFFFERFPTPQMLAAATFGEVFEKIKSISYPNNKAKHLIGMAQVLTQYFEGIVPDTIENLQKMPGVGRKTANVIASVLYNKPTMAVDTHVFRVANRIGITEAKNVLQTEKQLVALIDEKDIPIAHHLLILHGRYVCTARKPACETCCLANICGYYITYKQTQ